jgi:hypothetical protein
MKFTTVKAIAADLPFSLIGKHTKQAAMGKLIHCKEARK